MSAWDASLLTYYMPYVLSSLATPLSKHPAVRTDPLHTVGLAYAKAAEEVMFDSHGRLIVHRNLILLRRFVVFTSLCVVTVE